MDYLVQRIAPNFTLSVKMSDPSASHQKYFSLPTPPIKKYSSFTNKGASKSIIWKYIFRLILLDFSDFLTKLSLCQSI